MRADHDYDGPVYDRPTIVVHPLKENKAPVGFWPWPDKQAAKKGTRRPKTKKPGGKKGS